jgi:hypothetical protein
MPTFEAGCYNSTGSLTEVPGDSVVQAVTRAARQGIKSFIIGLPGSERARTWLSNAALAGGTSPNECAADRTSAPYCHLDLTYSTNLTTSINQTLKLITNEIEGCQFQVPTRTTDGQNTTSLNFVPVITEGDGTGLILSRDSGTNGVCNEGYRVLSPTAIELCQSTCALLKEDTKAWLQLLFGCSSTNLK